MRTTLKGLRREVWNVRLPIPERDDLPYMTDLRASVCDLEKVRYVCSVSTLANTVPTIAFKKGKEARRCPIVRQ